MATEEDVAAGLMDWINSLHVTDPVYTVDDLSNGRIFWKTLHKIDRLSFPGKLPEDPATEQWIEKWTNLKHVNDALSIFLTEECSQRLPLPGGYPDLKAVAQSSSLRDTIALMKLLVVAAINCRERIEFLKQMQDLAENTQLVLMDTAREAEEDEKDQMESEDGASLTKDTALEIAPTRFDSDLASEERLGRVIADNQRIAHEKRDLQRQLDDAYTHYSNLQERYDRSQDELSGANDRLTAVLAGRGEGQNRPLETKHEHIIAAFENRAITAEKENEDLRIANGLLKIRAEKVQKLQDDYDEVKIERDRLSRKANTAEKYKQKLEASQDLEKDNQNLRDKISELQMQLRQSDSTRVSSSDLQREIDEYRRLLPSIEQERYELNEMKKRLEFDYHTLEARYYDATEQLTRQQNTMEELRGRLLDYEEGITTSTPVEPVTKDLEYEKADFAESEARLTAALINGDVEGDDGISEEELRAIMCAVRAQAQASEASDRKSSIQAQKKLLTAIERSRSKIKQLLNHVQKQSELIHSLQTQASQAIPATSETEDASPTPLLLRPEKDEIFPPSAKSELKLEEALRLNGNLHRELRLMTSAWYDQNRRLANSGMATIRTRAQPEPRSFLGKQRRAVESVVLT